MTVTHTNQLTTAEVAEALGIKPASVRQYIRRGVFPPPDGRLGSTPWWHFATVEAWRNNERRGRGQRKASA